MGRCPVTENRSRWDMENITAWKNSLQEASQCLNQFISAPQNLELCAQFSKMMTTTIQNGGNLFSCGNGGSQCDAMHFAEEMTGRYRKERRPIGAMALGERVRSAVESAEWAHCPVTVSVGVATLAEGQGSAEALLQMTDEALYRSKREGRNRVSVAEADLAEVQCITQGEGAPTLSEKRTATRKGQQIIAPLAPCP